MKKTGKVAAAIVGGVISILGVIMARHGLRWPLWHRSLD